jgi:hypothetical protein
MADYIRPTPQNATLGAIAAALRKAQQFAGQYEVDKRIPLLGGTSVDELLSLPGAASLMEDVSYHGPRALIKGGNAATGGIGTFRLDPRTTDLADVALNVSPLAVLGKQGVMKGARALEDATVGAAQRARIRAAAARVPEDAAYAPLRERMEASGNLAYAVKPKGGNWRPEAAELGTDQLRQTPSWLSGETINEAAGENLWAKMVQEGGHRDPHEWLRQNRPDIYNQMVGPEGTAINRWLDTKLNKYIRNEMGTPDDPVKALAERGVLHFEPQGVRDQSPIMDQLRQRRQLEGYPMEGTATTPLGQQWERYSDYAIRPRTAGEIVDEAASSKFGGVKERAQMFLEQAPWIKKLDPETRVYDTEWRAFDNEALGFPHLIDELKFSMSPDSGLPANLRLDPKDIDKITVPQAVERVSKINAWRAEQAAQAEKAGMMENLTATPRLADEGLQLSFVGKPGGAWVDIPETVDEKGMKLCNSIGKAGGWCTQHDWAAKSYGSGENRLTALVDTEGRPHAQAKITSETYRGDLDSFDEAIKKLTPEQEAELRAFQMQLDSPLEMDDALAWLRENAPQAFEEFKRASAQQVRVPDITELKPPGNSFDSDRAREYIRRDPQYKAKVTDSVLKFLNGGEWGKVNDLHHYDIVDLKKPNSLLDGLKTLYGDESSRRVGQEFIDAFNYVVDTTPEAPRFMTTRQLREFIGPVEGLEGYAGGGIVKGAVKSIGELVQKYIAKETPQAAAEAAVTAAPKEQKMLQGFYRGYAGDYDAGKAAEDAGMVFVTPQRAAGEFYANKRARQTGLDPHLEMILADPFAGYAYGHAIPTGPMNRKVDFTKARQLQPTDVKERTPLYAEGGAFEAGEAEVSPFDTYKFANRQAVAGNDMSMAGFGAGANVGGGRLDAALEMARMQRAQDVVPQEMQNRMARMSYSKQLDDLGLNLTALKSLDTKDVYLGMLNGSIPMGLGRLLLGIQAEKTPWNTGVTGHSIGYSGRVGPGTLNANVQRRRSGDVSGNVEYRLPFAEGGAVNYDPDEIAQIAERATQGFAAGGLVDYDPNEIDTIVSRVKEEFHG